jgi:hypothetical protein
VPGTADEGLLSLGYTSAVLLGMLLLSPMSSTYHFCMLLPPIAFLVTYWIYVERNSVVAAVLGMQLVISLLGGDLFGRLADLALAAGLYTFDAALLLVACGYVLAWRVPRLATKALPPSKSLADQTAASNQSGQRPSAWRANAA